MSNNPTNEVNDVAPSSMNHVLGQQSVKAQVAVALEAAFADNRKFDSALLVGPPGLGKSALAHIISCELAVGFHEVLGQSIKRPADLNALLLAAKDKDVVHIDEAHELGKQFQTAIYLAMDKRRVFLKGVEKGGAPESIPLADFTLLLSTTDEYCLLQPLRDRMKLTLRFEFYAGEELSELVRQRSKALGWQVAPEAFSLIAQRARGTPRIALRLLQSCHRVCRSVGESLIQIDHLEKACELEQLDHLGLGPEEQKYMHILAASPARLNVLASALGLPTRTVAQVTEAFLLRAGLITKDHQGVRQLTSKGREHLTQNES